MKEEKVILFKCNDCGQYAWRCRHCGKVHHAKDRKVVGNEVVFSDGKGNELSIALADISDDLKKLLT